MGPSEGYDLIIYYIHYYFINFKLIFKFLITINLKFVKHMAIVLSQHEIPIGNTVLPIPIEPPASLKVVGLAFLSLASLELVG